VPVDSSVNLHVMTAVADSGVVPGAGTGRVYLMMHGFPEGWIAFNDVVPELLELDQTAKIILPDMVQYVVWMWIIMCASRTPTHMP